MARPTTILAKFATAITGVAPSAKQAEQGYPDGLPLPTQGHNYLLKHLTDWVFELSTLLSDAYWTWLAAPTFEVNGRVKRWRSLSPGAWTLIAGTRESLDVWHIVSPGTSSSDTGTFVAQLDWLPHGAIITRVSVVWNDAGGDSADGTISLRLGYNNRQVWSATDTLLKSITDADGAQIGGAGDTEYSADPSMTEHTVDQQSNQYGLRLVVTRGSADINVLGVRIEYEIPSIGATL